MVQDLWDNANKSSPKREIYSNTGVPQETREISNNLPFHLKKVGKKEKSPKFVAGNKDQRGKKQNKD